MRYLILLLILCLVSCDSEQKPVEPKAEQEASSKETVLPEEKVLPKVDVKVAWLREFPSGKIDIYRHDYTEVSAALAHKVLAVLQTPPKHEPDLDMYDYASPAVKVDSNVYYLAAHRIVNLETKETYYSEGLYKELYAEWLQYIVEVEAEENE